MKKNNKKGFTLVELVIVIAVIAILAAVLIPTFSNVIAKANESTDLQAARNALVEYKATDLFDGVLDGQEKTVTINMSKVSNVSVNSDKTDYTKWVYSGDHFTVTYQSGAWTTAAKQN